jgi:hypothetical protein
MGIFYLSRRRGLLKKKKKKKNIITAPVIVILPFLYNPKQHYGHNNYRGTEKETAATRYSILQGEARATSPDSSLAVRPNRRFHKTKITLHCTMANVSPTLVQPWLEVSHSTGQGSCGMARAFLQMMGSVGAERRVHDLRQSHFLVPVWRRPLRGRMDTGECRPREVAAE